MPMRTPRFLVSALLLATFLGVLPVVAVPAVAQQDGNDAQIIVSNPVYPVLTMPASDAPTPVIVPAYPQEINPRKNYRTDFDPNFTVQGGPDPLLPLQLAAPPAAFDAFDTPIFNFDGQGYTFLNPPDTVGDVGANHYIQMINATLVAVYNKATGGLLQQFDLTTLGGCTTGNGDPIVLYDQMADRWLLSEFGAGNSLCVFISQTADPLGAYYSYQFTTPSFPDYPKYAVWPDAYYVTANESSPSAFALDRNKMLAGLAATSQRFTAPSLSGFGFQAMTPSDLDGMNPPPPGAPNYIMRHRDTEAHGPGGLPVSDILEIWAFHVDFATPANSTFTQLPNIVTAEFDSDLCGFSSFFCIGMPGVPQGSSSSLDPLREVIMNRLAYRNFGDHETLVGNFVTDVDGANTGGVRWFELRKVGAGAWSLYQEGTYSPTTDNRWMGGIAMDGAGNIALGYNVSAFGGLVYPSLRYAGRLSSDPLGTMPQGRVHLDRRRRRQRQQPLRRLLRHERRSGGRLHLLVHRRMEPHHPVEHPHRRVQVRRLWHAGLLPRRDSPGIERLRSGGRRLHGERRPGFRFHRPGDPRHHRHAGRRDHPLRYQPRHSAGIELLDPGHRGSRCRQLLVRRHRQLDHSHQDDDCRLERLYRFAGSADPDFAGQRRAERACDSDVHLGRRGGSELLQHRGRDRRRLHQHRRLGFRPGRSDLDLERGARTPAHTTSGVSGPPTPAARGSTRASSTSPPSPPPATAALAR